MIKSIDRGFTDERKLPSSWTLYHGIIFLLFFSSFLTTTIIKKESKLFFKFWTSQEMDLDSGRYLYYFLVVKCVCCYFSHHSNALLILGNPSSRKALLKLWVASKSQNAVPPLFHHHLGLLEHKLIRFVEKKRRKSACVSSFSLNWKYL